MQSSTATNRNIGQHLQALSTLQENAIDALIAGNDDAETAKLVGVHRVTVTKWRNYNPNFQARLNERRREIWAIGIERLRLLIPKALSVLGHELDNPDRRLKAAVELLRLVPIPATLAETGPTQAVEIVESLVKARRSKTNGVYDDLLNEGKGLLPFTSDVEQTWKELQALSELPEPPLS